MKLGDIIMFSFAPRMMRPDVAKAYAGGEDVLERLEAKGLLAPKVRKKRITLYDRVELDRALDRIEIAYED